MSEVPPLSEAQESAFEDEYGPPTLISVGVYTEGRFAGHWYTRSVYLKVNPTADPRGCGWSEFIVPPWEMGGPETWLKDFVASATSAPFINPYDPSAPPIAGIELMDETGFVLWLIMPDGEEVSVVSLWEAPGSMDVLNQAVTDPDSLIQGTGWTQATCNTHGQTQCTAMGALGWCKSWVYWNGSTYSCGFRCFWPGNPCPPADTYPKLTLGSTYPALVFDDTYTVLVIEIVAEMLFWDE